MRVTHIASFHQTVGEPTCKGRCPASSSVWCCLRRARKHIFVFFLHRAGFIPKGPQTSWRNCLPGALDMLCIEDSAVVGARTLGSGRKRTSRETAFGTRFPISGIAVRNVDVANFVQFERGCMYRHNRWSVLTICFIGLFFLVPRVVRAQAVGTIVGTVTDP